MKNILIAWELGGGLGHINILKRFVTYFHNKGYNVTCAYREIRNVQEIQDLGVKVIPAPNFPASLKHVKNFRAGSFADILAVSGYSNVEHLTALVQSWLAIFDMVKPDLILADHSPTVALAAYERIPTVLISNGFCLPPANIDRFPVLRSDLPPYISQKKLYENICEVQNYLKLPEPKHVTDFLKGQARIVRCLPEFDPYKQFREGDIVGPLEELPKPDLIGANRKAYGYFSMNFNQLDKLSHALIPMKKNLSICFKEGDHHAIAKFLRTQDINVLAKPKPYKSAIHDYAMIMSHGTLNTCQAALAAGRPQIVIPIHMESSITASIVDKMGVGKRIDKLTPDVLKDTMSDLMNNRKLRDNTLEIADNIYRKHKEGIFDKTIETCEALLK